MKPSVILVSPYFPPSPLAGVHRVRHLAKHLPSAGWHPIVLCVDPAHYEHSPDHELARLVPSDVEIIRVPSVPAAVTRPLGLGDIGLRSWFHLRAALLRLLAARTVKAVLISGSPFYPMLLGSTVRQRFHVPVVLDFQDPWVSRWGEQQKLLSKAGLSHILAKSLEPRAVRSADFITCITVAQCEDMLARYPALDRARMAAIPIGGDPDDFNALEDYDERELDPRFIHLSYVGTVWPAAYPATRALIQGFARLRRDRPDLTSRIRLNFIGTTADPSNTTGFRVKPFAEEAGVLDSINEIPQRISYVRAIRIMKESHGILMVGSDERHYSASKIYPVLMSKRPYLSLFQGESAAHQTLTEAGGGVALSFRSSGELDSLTDRIADGLGLLAGQPESLGRSHPAAYADFHARAIACRFADVFDEAGRRWRQERAGNPGA